MPHRYFQFRSLLLCAVCLTFIGRSVAQAVPTPAPVPGHPVTRSPRPRQQPCWEVAGVSKSAMEERRSIQQQTRSEVEAVCADSSLTAQQRQQKIRQIHEQAKQQMDGLISPQQMESLKACQASRNHGGGHPSVAGGHGPCGEMPSKAGPITSPGNKAEPEDEN